MTAALAPLFTVFYQGQVAAAASVYVYQTGTTTPLTTYSDAALAVPNTNPIVADSNGQVVFYVPTTTALRLDLYTAGGIPSGSFIKTLDPVYPAAIASGGTSSSEATIASAATTDLGSAGVNLVKVTGTTTITSLGSSAVTTNPIYYVRFTGALVLTYNATSLSLPGSANITTAAGAAGIFEYLGSGNWQCLFYQTASGASLNGLNTTGSPATGNLSKFSGANTITNGDLSGDVTTSGTLATTLATVNGNVGSFTNANLTVNAKGLVTAAANGTPAIPTALGVGSVVLATYGGGALAADATTAGSNLQVIKINTAGSGLTGGTDTLSGTWKALQSTNTAGQGGLFERTA